MRRFALFAFVAFGKALFSFSGNSMAHGITLPTGEISKPSVQPSKPHLKSKRPSKSDSASKSDPASIHPWVMSSSIKKETLPKPEDAKNSASKKAMPDDVDPGNAPIEHVNVTLTPTKTGVAQATEFNQYIQSLGYEVRMGDRSVVIYYRDPGGKKHPDQFYFHQADIYGMMVANNYFTLSPQYQKVRVSYVIVDKHKHNDVALSFDIDRNVFLDNHQALFHVRTNVDQPDWSKKAFGEFK